MCLEPLEVAVAERMICDYGLSIFAVDDVEILRVGVHYVLYQSDFDIDCGRKLWVIIVPSLSETGYS